VVVRNNYVILKLQTNKALRQEMAKDTSHLVTSQVI